MIFNLLQLLLFDSATKIQTKQEGEKVCLLLKNADGFPMNVRAKRLITVEILRGYVQNVKNYEDMIDYLNNLGGRSRSAEHWINNLIKPVLIMVM